MKVGINRDLQVKIDDVVFLNRKFHDRYSVYDYGFAVGIRRGEEWEDNDRLLVQLPNGIVTGMRPESIVKVMSYEEFYDEFMKQL